LFPSRGEEGANASVEGARGKGGWMGEVGEVGSVRERWEPGAR
jgi:hypothetical protein